MPVILKTGYFKMADVIKLIPLVDFITHFNVGNVLVLSLCSWFYSHISSHVHVHFFYFLYPPIHRLSVHQKRALAGQIIKPIENWGTWAHNYAAAGPVTSPFAYIHILPAWPPHMLLLLLLLLLGEQCRWSNIKWKLKVLFYSSCVLAVSVQFVCLSSSVDNHF